MLRYVCLNLLITPFYAYFSIAGVPLHPKTAFISSGEAKDSYF